MDDKRIHLMREGKISHAVNKLAAPAIVGMLVMAIYNFVDTAFVSWYDPNAVCATQTVLPVMLIASAIGLSLGIGGGSYMSRLLGARERHNAEKVLATIFVLGIFLGLLTTTLNYIFMEEIFGFFGDKEDIHEMTMGYGKYILFGYTFMILCMILNNSLRSEGSARFQMIGMMAGSILNIILDPILIFGLDMGIEGAAIATTISNIFSFLILISVYLRKRSILKIKLSNFSFEPKIYKEVFVIGLPTLVKQLLFSYGMGLLNRISADVGGNDLFSAVGIVIRIIVVPSYVVFGYSQGFQPVAGYNFGADKPKRVMEALKHTIKLTTIITVVTALILIFLGPQVVKIFNVDGLKREYAVMGLRYSAVGLAFLGITNTITVFFQALGKGFKAMLLSISRQGMFFIPMILILPGFLGVEGVLMAQPVADILSLILAVLLAIPYFKSTGIEKLYAKTH